MLLDSGNKQRGYLGIFFSKAAPSACRSPWNNFDRDTGPSVYQTDQDRNARTCVCCTGTMPESPSPLIHVNLADSGRLRFFRNFTHFSQDHKGSQKHLLKPLQWQTSVWSCIPIYRAEPGLGAKVYLDSEQPTVNPGKLEHGFRRICARIPFCSTLRA